MFALYCGQTMCVIALSKEKYIPQKFLIAKNAKNANHSLSLQASYNLFVIKASKITDYRSP